MQPTPSTCTSLKTAQICALTLEMVDVGEGTLLLDAKRRRAKLHPHCGPPSWDNRA
jgi:hypothetical protein